MLAFCGLLPDNITESARRSARPGGMSVTESHGQVLRHVAASVVSGARMEPERVKHDSLPPHVNLRGGLLGAGARTRAGAGAVADGQEGQHQRERGVHHARSHDTRNHSHSHAGQRPGCGAAKPRAAAGRS